MPRIRPLEAPTGKSQELLQVIHKKLGRVPNMFKTLGHAPAALELYLSGSQALGGSSLSLKTREQLALLAAKENDCEYCAKAHAAIGKRAGLTDSDVADSGIAKAADPKTQAILRCSQRLIQSRGNLSDQEIAEARASGLTDAELLDIVAVTCFNIFTNYVNHLSQPEIDF